MKRLLLLLCMGLPALGQTVQFPHANLPLTGSIGAGGPFALLNGGPLVLTADADHTLTFTESTGFVIVVTSSVPLTATRHLIAPTGYYKVSVENLTTGGQAITYGGASGAVVTIPNGTWADVSGDSANYGTPPGGAVGVPSINGNSGPFTLGGSGVICSTSFAGVLSCTVSGGSGGSSLLLNPTGPQTVTIGAGTAGQTQFFSTNCLDNFGLGYGIAACQNDSATYNTFAPTLNDGSGNQSLIFGDLTAYGAGLDLGGLSKWRAVKAYNTYLYDYTRGIGQGEGETVEHRAVGDTAGKYIYSVCDGGSVASNDEGCTAISAYDGEFDQNSTNAYFHGTISSTTGTGDTAPTLTYTTGHNWVTDGAILLDISKGTLSGNLNGASVPMTPSYLNYLPVTGVTLPTTTAWGVMTGGMSWAGHPANVATNAAVTVTLQTIGGGTPAFPSSGVACIAGVSPPENAAYTAAAASGGTQVLTIAARNPHYTGDSVFVGGLCSPQQYISMDQDLSFAGIRSSYLALGSLTGTDMIYGFLEGGVIGNAQLPQGGLSAETGTGGFHLYPGAEIVANTNGAYGVQLEANSVNWANGDVIENPHPMAQKRRALSVQMAQETPMNGAQTGQGLLITLNGHGINSATQAERIVNANPSSYYTVGGGPLAAPAGIQMQGIIGDAVSVNNFPTAFIAETGGFNPSRTFTQMAGYTEGWLNLTAPLTGCTLTAGGTMTLTGTFPISGAYIFGPNQPVSMNSFGGACSPLDLAVGTPNQYAPPIITSVNSTTLVASVGAMTLQGTVVSGSTAFTPIATSWGGALGTTLGLNSCTGTGTIPGGTTLTGGNTLSANATATGTITCTISIATSSDTGNAAVTGVVAGNNLYTKSTGSFGTGNVFANSVNAAAVSINGTPGLGGSVASCTMTAATTCTAPLNHSFTTPICQVTQQGAVTGGAGGCSVSGLTATVYATTSNSGTWGITVFGNPN